MAFSFFKFLVFAFEIIDQKKKAFLDGKFFTIDGMTGRYKYLADKNQIVSINKRFVNEPYIIIGDVININKYFFNVNIQILDEGYIKQVYFLNMNFD